MEDAGARVACGQSAVRLAVRRSLRDAPVRATNAMKLVKQKPGNGVVAGTPSIAAPGELYAFGFSTGSRKTRNWSFSRPAGVRPYCGCYDRRGRRTSKSESTNQLARITQNS